MNFSEEQLDLLGRLQVKYDTMGQNMESYLDGLLHSNFLTYWEYTRLDTLLTLQQPRTSVPDEEIFILYHQITELYFKLIIKAIRQVAKTENLSATLFKRQLRRINDYFSQLIGSFGIMIEGMDKDEFLQFRMSLLPASGFQSAQYRIIELMSTDIINLVHHLKRTELRDDENASLSQKMAFLYWRSGATELATGKKTLTLQQFERKYGDEFQRLAEEYADINLSQSYYRLSPEEQADPELMHLLREHDLNANVRWPLQHFKSAVRYLDRKPTEIAATGGTNWQKYLAPKNQRVVFYRFLWTDDELDDWGKSV